MNIKLPLKKCGLGILTLLVGFHLTSCGCMCHGRTQTIPVSSSPALAAVYVDGEMAGFTPTTVTVSRKKQHVITIAKEGYFNQSYLLTPHLNGYFLGSVAGGATASVFMLGLAELSMAFCAPVVIGCVAAGTLLGPGADLYFGGAYTLTPKDMNVFLQPAASFSMPPNAE